jgi:hypothetical protein
MSFPRKRESSREGSTNWRREPGKRENRGTRESQSVEIVSVLSFVVPAPQHPPGLAVICVGRHLGWNLIGGSAVISPGRRAKIMRTTSRVLARKLIGHAAIGVVMGGALALWLLMRELDLNRMILDGSAPEAAELAVVASLTSLFAIGAGISGFVFMLFDNEP